MISTKLNPEINNELFDLNNLPVNNQAITISVPAGRMSLKQIKSLAIVIKRYASGADVHISSNLNIEINQTINSSRKELLAALEHYHLVQDPSDNGLQKTNRSRLGKISKLIIVSKQDNSLSVKGLLGLAALMELEGIKEIYLINQSEYYFEYGSMARLDVLRLGLNELGFKLRVFI